MDNQLDPDRTKFVRTITNAYGFIGICADGSYWAANFADSGAITSFYRLSADRAAYYGITIPSAHFPFG